MTNCFIPASRKSRDKLLLDDGWLGYNSAPQQLSK